MTEKKSSKPVVKDGKAVLEHRSYSEAHFSGPIPPPSVLEGYEKILPGAADRILTMAENQSKHRMSLENKVIGSKIRDGRLGMILGFVLASMISSIGGFVIWSGQSVVGYATILTAMGGLIGAFIYGTNSNRKERESKNKEI
ncbi:MAG: DUF2335 domain-containing protein [Peptostreptococcaceae bacterium]|nr:DUF2335 domain-containing protein [Peptostreptococcaceae bacterium]